MLVQVRNNDVRKAMKILKSKMFDEGIIKELTERRYYVKPSVRKRMKKKEAIRRHKKEQHKRAERYGLI